MPQLVLNVQDTTHRFFDLSANSRVDLLKLMNDHQEGMARCIQLGITPSGEWYAVFDRALPVVLTLDDVEGLNINTENDDTSTQVSVDSHVIMSA